MRIRSLARAVSRFRAALFREPYVSLALLAPAVFALVYAACVAAMRFWFECQLPYTDDAAVYWTVGNGIVHGLTPWKDLFETKPPGIFLLSAVSYRLLGNGHLTNVTQILSLLTIALSPAVYARRILRAPGTSVVKLPVFVALWALVVDQTSYVADNAGAVQTETHALPGLILYMVLIGARGRFSFILRAAGILIAIGMKEPFVLAVPAVYLVLDPETRDPWQDFFGPLALAIATGGVTLLLLGWLPAYINIYLKAMAGGHINVSGSPWSRVGAGFNNTWDALSQHSRLLPAVLLYLAAVYLFSPDSASSALSSRRVALRIQALLIAFLLASLAVGMGGQFYSHHYVFATPVHLAVVFALMAALPELSGAAHWLRGGVVALALLCVYTPKWVPLAPFRELLLSIRVGDDAAHRQARAIDTVLDRLKIARYLWIGHPGKSPLPFTHHLPLGPLFFQQVYFFEGAFPWLASQFEARLHEAKLIVFAEQMTGPMDAHVRQVIATEYDELPRSYIPEESKFPYKVYVRRGEPSR